MKTYVIEFNNAKRFQPANTVPVGEVIATSKKRAIEAFKFYLKSGISPVDAEVNSNSRGYYAHSCAFTAYEKI